MRERDFPRHAIMQTLRCLVSPVERLEPRAFIAAAVAIYLAGAASQLLTAPHLVIHFGLWLFAAVQAVLIWLWLCVHANRLRDAGEAVEPAVAASVLYALSIILLLLVVTSAFAGLVTADVNEMDAAGLIAVVLLLSVVGSLFGSAEHHDAAWLLTLIFTTAAFVPVIVALTVSIWAATRPGTRANI
jgi:hypothetical protein